MLLRIGQRILKTLFFLLSSVAGLAGPLVASGDESARRPPKSGIYVIWYSGTASSADLYLSQPYIVGGQIVLQWHDVEPAEGKYNFARIRRVAG